MNKISKALLTAMLIAVVVASAFYISDTDGSDAEAVTLTTDGLTFELTSDDGVNTAKLTSIDKTVTNLIVPEKVTDADGNQYTVTSVGAIGGTGTATSKRNTTLTSAVFPATVTTADSSFLRYCYALTEVSIPGIDAVPNNAFRNCSALKTVELSDNLESIGNYAFYKCSALDISGSLSVKSIGNYAFQDCTSLNVSEISDVETIGGYAFWGCTAFDDLTISGKVASIGQNSFHKSVFSNLTIMIADEAAIGFRAFQESGAEGSSIVFSGGKVTSLEGYAFCNSKIAVLDADFNLTSIGNYAFAATDLKGIVIEGQVDSIGEAAFRESDKMTDITIEGKPTVIGSDFIRGCTSLVTLDVDLSAVDDFSTDNDFSGLNKLVTPIIFDGTIYHAPAVEEYTVPDSVTTVGSSAFAGSTVIKRVVLPASITSVAAKAFQNCTALESVVFLSDNVLFGTYWNGMDEYVSTFANCTSLKNVTLPSSLTKIGSGMFQGCSSLESISIPNTVLSIGIKAFYGSLENVRSITVPGSVLTIEKYAFSAGDSTGMSAVTSIVIEKGSELTIGDYAFQNNDKVTEIVLPANITSVGSAAFNGFGIVVTLTTGDGKQLLSVPVDLPAEGIPSDITSIGSRALMGWTGSSLSIPGSVKDIGTYAFQNCTSLEELTVPSSVTAIGDYAFTGCSKLSKVNLSEGLKTFGLAFKENKALESISIPSTVTSIDDNAFYMCSGLVSVNIANGPASIGEYAFYRCTSLTAVSVPSSVMTVGKYAFSGCTALASVEIASGLTAIPNYLFDGCKSLTGIALPESIASIGAYAFQNCSSMATVVLKEGLKSIGNYAFSGCDQLKSVTFPTTLKSIGASAFSGCKAIEDITFKGTSVSFEQIRTFYPPNRFVVLAHTFASCTSLKTVVLPSQLESLPRGIFYGCTALESVALPSTLTAVGDDAFYNCKSLTQVTGTVETIGASSFYGCTSLTTVPIGEGTTSIGASAFYGCTALDTLKLPVSLTSCGTSAFQGCTALKNLTLGSPLSGQNIFRSCTGLEKISLTGGYMSIAGSGIFTGCTNVKEIDLVAGSYTVSCSGFTALTTLKIYANTAVFDITNAPSGLVVSDEIGTYVPVTFVGTDGAESEGRYYTTFTAESIVLPANAVGVSNSAIKAAMKAGTVSVAENNHYLSIDGVLFYCGTSLVASAETSEAIVVKDGTAYLGYRSLYRSNRTGSSGSYAYSPYILLPESLKAVESSAFNLYSATGTTTAVLFRSTPSVGSSNTVSAYYALGTDISTASISPTGYWYLSDGAYTLFTSNDYDHATVTVTSAEASKVSFTVGLDLGYSKSQITVSAGGEAVSAVDGTYTVDAGSTVTISGISESKFNVTVNGPDNVDVSVSSTVCTYGQEVTLTVSPSSSVYSVTDVVVTVGGAAVAVSDDGTYLFPVTGDMSVSVTATVTLIKKTVSFNTNGGSAVDPVEVVIGEVFELPENAPVKTGYTFYAWYFDAECTEPAAATSVEEDITIYARWIDDSLEKFTVSFEADSGSVSALLYGIGIESGSKVSQGSDIVLTYNGGRNHEVVAWYVNGIKQSDVGDSIKLAVSSDTAVTATTEYHFGDISNLISEAEGISESDLYGTAWTLAGTMGYVIVGNYAYIPLNTGYFCKVDMSTGDIVTRYQTNVLSGKDWPAAGNGMVLDARSGIVFDLDLNPLYKLGTTSQWAFYDDGCWYVNPSRSIVCYSALDEDTDSALNVQKAKWSTLIYGYFDAYTLPTTLNFGKGYIVYVGTGGDITDNGRYIYTIDKETGKLVDSYCMTTFSSCYWNYGYIYCAEGYVTVKCQWATLFGGSASTGSQSTILSIKVDDEGHFDTESAKYYNLGLIGYGTSVVIYEGLGYLWTSGYFIVLDLSSGKVLAKQACGSAEACRTNLSLAVGKDGIVHGYNVPYTPDETRTIRSFEYDVSANKLTTYYLNPATVLQYTDADFVKISQSGQILMRNDSGYTICVSPMVEVTIEYEGGTTATKSVAVGAPLGTDPAVETYYVDALTVYDTSLPVTGPMKIYAKLNPWYIDGNTLVVNSVFEMKDYSRTDRAPWASEDFTSVVLAEGITYIGAYAFYANVDIESVSFPSTLTKVGDYAFYGCVSLTTVLDVPDNLSLGDDAFVKTGLSFYVLYKNDGTKYAKVYYGYGSSIDLPADPSKTGYTFAGWEGISDTMPMRNLSVKSVFSLNEYTITFDTDGGSAVDPISQDYGTAITAPAAPTKTGYTFAGWDSLPKTMPAENVTVKALWTADTHSVTVKYVYADGTEASAPATETVEYNAKYSIESPAIVGYYTDKTTVADTMGTEDVTVTVTYLKDTFAYTVGGKVSQSGVNTVVDISLERTSGHTDIQNARLLVIAMYEGGIAVNVCPSATLTDGTGSEQVVVSSNDLVSVTVQVVSGIPSGAYDNYGSYLYDATAVTVTVAAGENGTVSVKEPIEVSSGTTISTEGDKVTVGETVVTATPSEGYAFSEWTVTDASGKVYEKTVVDEDITVTAKFEAIAKTAE